MLIFKELTYKNFLSYGNVPTTFHFASGITRIRGENGAGKSSCILDPLFFALFGKPYRKKQKLEHLINAINKKDLEVSLLFESGSSVYRIERGIKPHYFRMFKDDELIDISSHKKDYQQHLEEDILHFNENIFDQTVAKSLTKNISFLALSKYEKRNIAEGIFNIEIFSVMNRLAKENVTKLEDKISKVMADIQHCKVLIEREVVNLDRLKSIKEKMDADTTKEKERILAQIEDDKQKLNTFTEALQKIDFYKNEKAVATEKLKSITAQIKATKKDRDDLSIAIQLAEKKLELFTKTCPGCAKLEDINTGSSFEVKREKYTEIIENLKVLVTDQEATQNNISKLDSIINNERFVKNSIDGLRKNITNLENTLKEQNTRENIVIDESVLIEYKKKRLDKEKDYNSLSRSKKHMAVIRNLLADEGIKSFIIKRYLPYINKLLNTYLQKFQSDILFYFDTEFNEVIGTRNKEKFNYYSFSEGQKRRIDMAILFSFLEFCKIKNRKSDTNLLVLDEITAGVDANGENMLYDILREIVHKEGKEIVTVSHSMAIDSDKIDNCYDVRMEKGFSILTRAES